MHDAGIAAPGTPRCHRYTSNDPCPCCAWCAGAAQCLRTCLRLGLRIWEGYEGERAVLSRPAPAVGNRPPQCLVLRPLGGHPTAATPGLLPGCWWATAKELFGTAAGRCMRRVNDDPAHPWAAAMGGWKPPFFAPTAKHSDPRVAKMPPPSAALLFCRPGFISLPLL